MSSARQAVQRADSFIGFGNRPDFTPSHQLVLPKGITVNTCDRRKKPVSGMSCISKFFSLPTSHTTISDPQLSRRNALTAGFRDFGMAATSGKPACNRPPPIFSSFSHLPVQDHQSPDMIPLNGRANPVIHVPLPPSIQSRPWPY